MTKHRQILNTISLIRDSHSNMIDIFTKGSCLNLFLILHSIYPEAKPLFNIDHVITEIDNRCYDITGQVSKKGYSPFSEYYNKKGISKSFSQMLKYDYRLTKT